MASPTEMMRTWASRKVSSSNRPKLLRREKREKSLTIRTWYSPRKKQGAQLSVGLPLVEGVTRPIPVYEEVQGGVGKILRHKSRNDLLLVLYGGVVLVFSTSTEIRV